MTCQCELKLDKCLWPGQCEMDIKRYNGEYMSGPYFTDEEWEEQLKKTNQQATANHTAKMFNQSWNGNPAKEPIFNMTINNYYEKYLKPEPEIEYVKIPIKQWYKMMYEKETKKETKMTRKEAIEISKELGNQFPDYEFEPRLLEALGLIKFDEEKSIVDEAKEYVRNYTLYNRQELAGVIDMLIRHIEK